LSNPPPKPAPDLGQIWRRLGPVGPLALVAASLPGLGGFVLLGTMKWSGQWLRDAGDGGVLLYVAGFAVAAGLALLPTYAQSVLAGFAFGMLRGTAAALAGVAGACLIGYAVARRASGERVVRMIEEQPRWKAVRDALIGGGPLKTLAIVTLLRAPPNSPFAITNLVLASTGVPWPTYLAGTLLGIAPRTAVAVKIGADMTELNLRQGRSVVQLVISIVSAVVVLGILGTLANRAVARVTRPQDRDPGAADS